MNSNTENTTKELLKKSLIIVPDEGFSDRVMERIHLEAGQKKTILSSISKAWIFTILSMVLIPFALSVIVRDFKSINIIYIARFVIDPTSLSILLSTFFGIIILLILDSLIRLTFSRRQYLNF